MTDQKTVNLQEGLKGILEKYNELEKRIEALEESEDSRNKEEDSSGKEHLKVWDHEGNRPHEDMGELLAKLQNRSPMPTSEVMEILGRSRSRCIDIMRTLHKHDNRIMCKKNKTGNRQGLHLFYNPEGYE